MYRLIRMYLYIYQTPHLWPWLMMKWRCYDSQVSQEGWKTLNQKRVMEVILRFWPWIYRHFMSCCFQLAYIVIVLLTWSQVWKHFRWDTLLVQGRHLCKCVELGETWYQYPLTDTVSRIIYVYIYILVYVNSIDVLNSRMDWYGECCFWNQAKIYESDRQICSLEMLHTETWEGHCPKNNPATRGQSLALDAHIPGPSPAHCGLIKTSINL